MEGFAIQTWDDGRSYRGDFKNDAFNGHGIYKWADGSEYDGTWKNGK